MNKIYAWFDQVIVDLFLKVSFVILIVLLVLNIIAFILEVIA